MSTYVISDIHGALAEFKTLLKKIEFHYDGSDTLYLLGDYCDWGSEPLGALQFVMDLDRRCPFVHCLIGNHESMFLDAIRSAGRGGRGFDGNEQNWFFSNRGLETWAAYLELPAKEKEEIAAWLEALPYSAETVVGGKRYLMAHAFPYFEEMACSPAERQRRKTDAVWRRLMIRENPFGYYEGPKTYDMFICGHTITEYYFYKLRFEKGWPFRKPEEHVYNRIFHAERFIDIDCGAKCLTCENDANPALRRGALRAQLACLRLEDGWECYTHPVRHRYQQVIPEVQLPEARPGGMKLPELKPVQVRLPEMRTPKIQLPALRLSAMKLPELKVQEARAPRVQFPVRGGASGD